MMIKYEIHEGKKYVVRTGEIVKIHGIRNGEVMFSAMLPVESDKKPLVLAGGNKNEFASFLWQMCAMDHIEH